MGGGGRTTSFLDLGFLLSSRVPNCMSTGTYVPHFYLYWFFYIVFLSFFLSLLLSIFNFLYFNMCLVIFLNYLYYLENLLRLICWFVKLTDLLKSQRNRSTCDISLYSCTYANIIVNLYRHLFFIVEREQELFLFRHIRQV